MSSKMSRRDFLRLSALMAVKAACFSVGVPGLAMAASAAPAPSPVPALESAADELAYLPAAEQIRRFKAGTLSPVDVLEAQIARIKKYNGPLNASGAELKDYKTFNGMVNAISYEHYDEARKAARDSERRYREGIARPLEGLTMAVKDENDVKGWRVTMGSVPYHDAPLCEEDSPLIEMLRAQGVVMHIQTNVPELYLHTQTWSKLWGVTRNPWNLHYAVGGSSGGSGAALAAGFATLATGSDMGGSIRIPSSLCGVYGFKAPFGRVPTSEISFETVGPMARSFEELVMMQNACVGPHPKVHASLRPRLDYPAVYGSLKGVKIAMDYFGDWIDEGTDASIRKSLDDAAAVLRSQGAIVDEVKLGWRCDDIFGIFVNGLLSTAMGDMLLAAQEYKSQTTSYAAKFLDAMNVMGPGEMAKSDALVAMLHAQLQEEIYGAGYEALIMPTLLTPYFPADNDPTTDSVLVNGKAVKGTRFAVTMPWNLLSRYPVLDVPVGIADNNVPMGMQIIGNTYDDLAAFRVGYGYSQAGAKFYQGDLFPDYRNKA